MEDLGLQFRDRRIFLVAASLVGQQVIVASSSYWLVYFTTSLKTGEVKWQWLIVYLVTLVLPYIPGAVALYSIKAYELQALQRFWLRHQSRLLGRIDLFNDADVKSRLLAAKVKEGPELITDYIHFGYDFVSSGLNAIFNVVVIVGLLGPVFGVSYFLSLVLAAMMIRISSKNNAQRASDAEQGKLQLTKVLRQSWDNLVINNRASRDRWQQSFGGSYETFRIKSLKAERTRHLGSVAMILVTFGPSLIAISAFSYLQQGNLSALTSLGVLLPRLFMILNQTGVIVYLVRDMSLYRGRLRQVNEALRLPSRNNLRNRFNLSKIQMENAGKRFNHGFNIESLPQVGWITVRGTNGAGKSSLLCHLKEQLGDQGFYYPARADLDFCDSQKPLSTGQKTFRELNRLLSDNSVSVLLLDEWDANLDKDWRTQIEDQIRVNAKHRLIVDVRHHH